MRLIQFLFLINVYLLSSHAMAAMPKKPEVCPKVDMLLVGGFKEVRKRRDDGTYTCLNTSYYHTKDPWAFAIFGIKAEDDAAAMTQCREVLKSLQGSPNPRAIENLQLWACDFNAGHYLAMTLTPIFVFK